LLTLENRQLLAAWPATVKSYEGAQFVTKVRGQEQQTNLTYTTLSGTKVRKVVLPRWHDEGDILHWLGTVSVRFRSGHWRRPRTS
jgi:isobutyryl-CoA mutase